MSKKMLAYFKKKLLDKRARVLQRLSAGLLDLPNASDEREELTRATQDSDLSLKVDAQERLTLYLEQINAALKRIKDRTYGYCAKTQRPINLRRLEIQPIARYCLEVQEEIENHAGYGKPSSKLGLKDFLLKEGK